MVQASKGHDLGPEAAATLASSSALLWKLLGTGMLYAVYKVTLGQAGWGSLPLPKPWAARKDERQ